MGDKGREGVKFGVMSFMDASLLVPKVNTYFVRIRLKSVDPMKAKFQPQKWGQNMYEPFFAHVRLHCTTIQSGTFF